jgi:hypothetical protein
LENQKNLNSLKMWTFDLLLLKRVAYFSEPRWTSRSQILQARQCNAYLSTDTQISAFWCCMQPWTLREVPKKRPIGVVSKLTIHPRKSGSLNISR